MLAQHSTVACGHAGTTSLSDQPGTALDQLRPELGQPKFVLATLVSDCIFCCPRLGSTNKATRAANVAPMEPMSAHADPLEPYTICPNTDTRKARCVCVCVCVCKIKIKNQRCEVLYVLCSEHRLRTARCVDTHTDSEVRGTEWNLPRMQPRTYKVLALFERRLRRPKCTM